jgi:predicted nucleotidyltransferase
MRHYEIREAIRNFRKGNNMNGVNDNLKKIIERIREIEEEITKHEEFITESKRVLSYERKFLEDILKEIREENEIQE